MILKLKNITIFRDMAKEFMDDVLLCGIDEDFEVHYEDLPKEAKIAYLEWLKQCLNARIEKELQKLN